jgi:hypothetical protein
MLSAATSAQNPMWNSTTMASPLSLYQSQVPGISAISPPLSVPLIPGGSGGLPNLAGMTMGSPYLGYPPGFFMSRSGSE